MSFAFRTLISIMLPHLFWFDLGNFIQWRLATLMHYSLLMINSQTVDMIAILKHGALYQTAKDLRFRTGL